MTAIPPPESPDLPRRERDPVIDAYKRDVDRTLLIENLRLTPGQRLEKFVCFMEDVEALRASALARRATR